MTLAVQVQSMKTLLICAGICQGYSIPLVKGELTIQGGRQMISFGTERVLGTRYGPNVPLSFDGGLVHWNEANWDVHGFYLRPVEVAPDPLDNLSSSDQQAEWTGSRGGVSCQLLPVSAGLFHQRNRTFGEYSLRRN